MYKEILRSITGIEVFPLISLGLFLVAFTVVVISALRLDRDRASRMARLPLDGTDAPAPCRAAATCARGDHQ